MDAGATHAGATHVDLFLDSPYRPGMDRRFRLTLLAGAFAAPRVFGMVKSVPLPPEDWRLARSVGAAELARTVRDWIPAGFPKSRSVRARSRLGPTRKALHSVLDRCLLDSLEFRPLAVAGRWFGLVVAGVERQGLMFSLTHIAEGE